jgi:hypothetical protein
MGMKTVQFANNLGGAQTYRGNSHALWYDCPIEEFLADNDYGRYWRDDFAMIGNVDATSAVKGSVGQWSAYLDAGGFIADGAADGAVIRFGSDGDNEGVTLLSSAGSVRLMKSVSGTLLTTKKTWFEVSVGTTTIAATKRDDFVGLAIPALSSNLPRAAYPITTTDDTLDATNGTFFGFHRKGTASPTDWSLVFNLAGGTINYVTNLGALLTTALGAALAASQMVKLGFKLDPSQSPRRIGSLPTARQTANTLAQPLITVFVNGVEIFKTFLTAADVLNATAAQAFPTGFMSPCLATMNQTGTTPGSMLADWIAIGQYADS